MENKNKDNLDKNLDNFSNSLGSSGVISGSGIIFKNDDKKPKKDEYQQAEIEKPKQNENIVGLDVKEEIKSLKENKQEEAGSVSQEQGEQKTEPIKNHHLEKIKTKLLRMKIDIDILLDLVQKVEKRSSRFEHSFDKSSFDAPMLEAEAPDGSKVVEGVFTGEDMIGPDGKRYSTPSNYASKSKLLEGDILKLTIEPSGKFIYKQIGPIERARINATIIYEDKKYYAVCENKKWQLLNAAVSFFKGKENDEVTILVPREGESHWAAVENIVKKA